MEPESFNIDDYIKDGKLNLTEKTYRKYDKEFIATKIIDKIQSGELKFPYPPEYCTPKFKEDAFQILKKYEPEIVKTRHSNYQQKLTREVWQKMNLTADGYKSGYVYINTQPGDYEADKLVDCFTGLQRMKCKREGKELSPFAAWNNKEYMKLVIEKYMEDKEDLTSFNLRESFYKLSSKLPEKYKNMECNFFKATLAASVYDYFLKDSTKTRVLDISAGWGDRLLAALAKNLDSYLAYDPNASLQPGYRAMIDEYMESKKDQYKVIDAPFESAEENLKGREFDLIFTSPPYFDLEVFTTEGEQSIISHSTFDKWMVHFLFKSLYIAWNSLASDGNMVIHIDDFNKGLEKHRIIEPMVLFVCGWCTSARFDGVVGASGYNKKKDYKSPMWVFKKKSSKQDEIRFCKEMMREKYPALNDLIAKNKDSFVASMVSSSSTASAEKLDTIVPNFDAKGKLCVIQNNKYNIKTKKGLTPFYINLEHVLKRAGFTVKLLEDDYISNIKKIQGQEHEAEMDGGGKKDKEQRALLIKKRLERARSKVAQPVERDLGEAESEIQGEEGEGEEGEGEEGLPRISFAEAVKQQREREEKQKQEEIKELEEIEKQLESSGKEELENLSPNTDDTRETIQSEPDEQVNIEEVEEIKETTPPQSQPESQLETKTKKLYEKQKVDLLLNFEDLFIDKSVPRFFSGMNIANAYAFYKKMQSEGTVIYPPPDFSYYTNSKTYSVDLHDAPENEEFVLPNSKTFLFSYSGNPSINQTRKEMLAYFKDVQEKTDYVIVKNGFSADMTDVYLVITQKAASEKELPKEIEKAFPQDKRFVMNENVSDLMDIYTDFIRENNVDLVVIAEPYNKIVSNRKNEYRMWYLGGKFVDYFCFGIERDDKNKIKMIDNIVYNSKNEIHFQLKKLADKLYQVVLKNIRSLLKDDDFIPVAMRFDMSYATDAMFIDKYAVEINKKGQKGKVRFYCNEVENMDGTFYTNIPVVSEDGKRTSLGEKFEKDLIKLLTSAAFSKMSSAKQVQTAAQFKKIVDIIRKYTMKSHPSVCNGITLKNVQIQFGDQKKPTSPILSTTEEKEVEEEEEVTVKGSEELEPAESVVVVTPVVEEKEVEKEKDKEKDKEKPAKKIKVKILKPKPASDEVKGKEASGSDKVDPDTIIGSVALRERMRPPSEKIIASPYFMNNRKIFVDFINKFFETRYKDVLGKEGQITCKQISNAKTDSAAMSLFPHQQIVKDYLNLYTPYRGLLLFHGLGSGKTCSSIAIAEGIKTEKQIIIMTPASLQANYRNDLKKCGDEFYKRNQHWDFISVKDVNVKDKEEKIAQLSKILNIDVAMIKENGGAWMINVSNPKNNYPDLTTEQQEQLEAQLDKMIEAKYKFINYNGLNKNKIAELTSNGKVNPFDNAVVIIDEAHRIVNSISNQLKNMKPTKTDEKKAKALISIQLYKYLQNADNSKIILLTGTPIINYPNELAVLFNILRGYIKTWSFKLTVDKDQKFDESSIIEMLKKYNVANYDYVKYTPSSQTVTITRNPFGFTPVLKGKSGGKGDVYAGVIKNVAGDESNEQFLRKINQMFASEHIRTEEPVITNFTALPDKFEDFKNKFLKVNPDTFEIIGVKELPIFQRRILGLASYFKSAQEQLMPRLLAIKLEKVPMSNMQYSEYVDVRTDEITKTKRSQKNKNMYEVSSNSYRIFSRLCCNFVFPPADETTGRPARPKKEKLNEQNVDAFLLSDEGASGHREAQTFVEGGEEEAAEVESSVDGSYNDKIRQLFQYYENHGDDLKARDEGGRLNEYSPKFLKMLQNITNPENKGLNLIYSQFRSLEGIGMMSLVLNANGFAQFKIKKDKDGEGWFVDIAPEDQEKPMYALYTGTEDTDEKEIIRNIFNSDFASTPQNIKGYLERRKKTSGKLENKYGEIIKVFMITASGSEGINLRNVRFVHVTEPYWNAVRVEQVVGRARRICSHEDLPEDEKTVQVFEYLTVFSPAQKETLNKELKSTDDGKTTDQSLFDLSKKKEQINRELLDAVKNTSVDCKIHKGTKCFEFLGTPDSTSFSYVPNIELDETEKELVANVAVEEEEFKLLPAAYKGENGERLIRSLKTNKVYYKDDKFETLSSSGKPFDVKELNQYGRIEQVGEKLKMFKN
jgi:hypothetical protein